MKKLIAAFLIVLLSGCTISIDETDKAVWDEINDVEFHNYDVWAGQGLYFYEDNGDQFCKYMKFGSGVPVLFEFDSEVSFTEEGSLSIMLPDAIIAMDYTENASFNLEEVILQYVTGEILWDEMTYIESDIRCFDGC